MAVTELEHSIQSLLNYFSYVGHLDGPLKTTREQSLKDEDGFADLFGAIASLMKKPEESPSIDPATARDVSNYLLDVSEGGHYLSALCGQPGVVASAWSVTPNINKIVSIVYGDDATSGATPYMAKNSLLIDPTQLFPTKAADVIAQAKPPATPALPDPPPSGNGWALVNDGKLNSNPKSPDKRTAPSMGGVVLHNLATSPSMRHTDAVSLFMNAIPTIEMSRCAPYINLRFITDRPPISDPALGGRVNNMSLIKFLGVYKVYPQGGKANYGLAATSIKEDATSGMTGISLLDLGITDIPVLAERESSVANTGMEIFTAPQTLVNPMINTGLDIGKFGGSSAARAQAGLPPVFDPFRPFMTLRSLTVTQYGSGQSAIGFTRAKLSIRLHDRARMSEVSSILSADAFGMTGVYLEYGWSHPDGRNMVMDPPNHYGRFLDSLRIRELYRISVGSYSLLSDGQVDINLTLGAQGGAESSGTSVAMGEFVPAQMVESLIRREVSDAIAKSTGQPQIENILPKQYLSTKSTSAASSLVPKAFFEETLALVKGRQEGGASGSVIPLLAQLTALIGPDGNTGLPALSKTGISTIIRQKIAGLNPASGTRDPFLIDIPNITIGGYPKWRTSTPDVNPTLPTVGAAPVTTESASGSPYVSLGKFLMSFVAAPLALSHRFDEVQILFYAMNPGAGALHNSNIANFPISFDSINRRLAKAAKAGAFTVDQAIMLAKSYVNNPQNPAYGFDGIYEGTANPAAAIDFTVGTKMRERMKQCNMLVSEYKWGMFTLYYETVPVRIPNDPAGVTKVMRASKEILRIHVYDGNASSHVGAQYALNTASVESLQNIYAQSLSKVEGPEIALPPQPSTGAGKSLANMIAKKELFQEVKSLAMSDVKVFKLIGANEELKKAVTSVVPTILFGCMYSTVESLTLDANTSGGVAEAKLHEAYKESKDTQASTGDGMIGDVLVIPARVNMVSLGCPLLRYGQQFFLDLGTGTTADNIYAINNITHTIGPGGFKSEVAFGFLGGGGVKNVRDTMINQTIKLTESLASEPQVAADAVVETVERAASAAVP